MLIGLSLFTKLQDPIRQLPNIINNIIESDVSLKRIEEFIRQPEAIDENSHKQKYDENLDYAIKIKNGNFSWGVKQEEKKDKNKDNNKSKKEELKADHRNTINNIDNLSENLINTDERSTRPITTPGIINAVIIPM